MSDSDSDFEEVIRRPQVLPGGSRQALQQMLQNATASAHAAVVNSRGTRRRGPTRTSVRLRLYLLPEGTRPPRLKGKAIDTEIVELHHSCNYGFPNRLDKAVSFAINSTNEDVQRALKELYPSQPPSSIFGIFKFVNRNLVEITEPIECLYGFKGVVWLKIMTETTPPAPRTMTEATTPPAPRTMTEATTPPAPRTMTEATRPMTPLRLNRDLVAAQDREFAEALAVDMARAIERERHADERRLRMENTRLLRQRRRDLAAGLGDEPLDGQGIISIVIRLPVRNIQRRFAMDSQCSDVYQFAQANTQLVVRSISTGTGQLLQNSTTTLREAGVTTNSSFNAEVVESDEESEEDSDGEDDIPISIIIKNLTNIHDRADAIRGHLRPAAVVTVRRDSIVDDLISHYSDEEVIDQVHRNVIFKFEDEPAVDVGGVTRDVFSLFFSCLFTTAYFSGDAEVIPVLDHRVLFSGFYELIGRIIAHAFVVVGYFPVRLCKASVLYILTGKCPSTVARDSFLRCLPQSESHVIQKLLNGHELSQAEEATTVRCLSSHGCMRMPTSENINSMFSELATLNTLCVPSVALAQLARGMQCYTLLWQGITPGTLDDLYKSLQPSSERIIQIIKAEFTGDDEIITDETLINLRALEEIVHGYLERYISGLSDKDLGVFLKFWTGSDVLVVPELRVCFNSQQGVVRRPMANTCSAQLNLSRYYFSYEEFSIELTAYLGDSNSERFDSI